MIAILSMIKIWQGRDLVPLNYFFEVRFLFTNADAAIGLIDFGVDLLAKALAAPEAIRLLVFMEFLLAIIAYL
jgi:hypothetical protein